MQPMNEIEITKLQIAGFNNNPVPNRFIKQGTIASTLAVIYPGLRYTCDMPLLYYPAELLREKGFDVLQVHNNYTSPVYQSLHAEDRMQWINADATAAVQTSLQQRSYEQVILIGKSIGTLALAHLVEIGETQDAITLWLTPLLHQPLLVAAASLCKAPALFISGSTDPTYDPSALDCILKATGAEELVIEGANHSLEIPGDILASLNAMETILAEINAFFERHNV
jgi:alpha-beta hydrolase superfamily lysophospholipase